MTRNIFLFAKYYHDLIAATGMAWRFEATNPTVDFYFRSAMKSLIGQGVFGSRKGTVELLGPNSFRYRDNGVVVRYATHNELARLQSLRVFYVVDDLIPLAHENLALPENYRNRLQVFAQSVMPEILNVTDVVCAPNQMILDLFPDRRGEILAPCHLSVCDDFSHFDNLGGKPIKIAYLGTRSHLQDLNIIAPALAKVMQSFSNITVTTYLGDCLPRELARLPGLDAKPALPWRLFKRILRREKYHIALAPMYDNAFNRARSFSKIHDHASVGAVGLYSALSPYCDVINDGKNGLLIAEEPDCWAEALTGLLNEPERLKSLAMAGAELSRRIGDPEDQKAFWLKQFNVVENFR